ncbi:MAG TPA: hypothetical protein VLC95_06660 [Anaerolineae bacterium]|nr:hypothetical protein [Anaerolineae bacterium]
MTNTEQKSPAQLREERAASLRQKWNQLSLKITLGHLRDEIEDRAGEIEALPAQLAGFANRGYRYGHELQAQAGALRKAWPVRRRDALATLNKQARALAPLGQEVQKIAALPRLSDTMLNQLDQKLAHLQTQTDAAEREVRGTFDALGQQLYKLQRELASVKFMLDSLDTACFDLYPDESGVAACEAEWTNHPDEIKGLLFLTDGRVIFEQREKKAKKKVLFVTTQSELVQEKLWEAPVGSIAEVVAEDRKKFLSSKEMLHLRLREYSGGLYSDPEMRLEGATNEEWAGLIKRVQRGELGPAPAATPAGAAAATPTRDIPTRCPACGGQLPALVKGMRELVCEYCGTVTRI